MDDELLDLLGDFKDDGIDDLDDEDEAALLGVSDDEQDTTVTGDSDREYVDEDGNPVKIGKNNAEEYEVAPQKIRNPTPEEDLSKLNLERELDTFSRDNSKEIAHKFSQPRNSADIRRKDAAKSTRGATPILEFEDESEDEIDDHRERFKSERSNIITLTPAKKRDIPDTLESVISAEETARVEAFLENEQRRKTRFKGRPLPRMKNGPRFPRNPQNLMQQPQQSLPQSQPRKILVNPHFRGTVCIPPGHEQGNGPPPQEMSPIQNTNFQPPPPQNYAPPPMQYAHQPQAPQPPSYGAPPHTPQYGPPDYMPPPSHQQHIQQPLPPVWQPPQEPIPPYQHVPPQPAPYHDQYNQPVDQYQPPHNYQNNYTPPYQNSNYQPQHGLPPPPHQAPPPQQPVPHYNPLPQQVHMPPHSFQHPPQDQYVQQHHHHQPQHRSPQRQQYHERRYNSQENVSQNQNHNFPQNRQMSRPTDKRPSNMNIKSAPVKQVRIEPRKNTHVNSSNIREIPLVDTLSSAPKKIFTRKNTAVAEEEDEKTRELRLKIEEQKQLREKLLQMKEERRRQMATQRLQQIKQRQSDGPTEKLPAIARLGIKPKANVRERIGIPNNQNGAKVNTSTQKKIVVVRKKTVQPSGSNVPIQPKASNVLINKPVLATNAPTNPPANLKPAEGINQQLKRKAEGGTPQPKKIIALKKNITETPNQALKKDKPNITTPATTQKKFIPFQKRNIMNRLGDRNNFHRPQLKPQRPRMPLLPDFGGPPFRPPRPFMEHNRFPGPPMMEGRGPMRMPPHNIRRPGPHPSMFPEPCRPFPMDDPPPFGHFPPDHPMFRVQGPPFQNFPPHCVDRFPPPRGERFERFPHPPFPNQGPPMRNVFQRPRHFKPNMGSKPVNKIIPKKKDNNNVANVQKNANATTEAVTHPKPQESVSNNAENTSKSVSVENLSSSTSEAQLKKLCTSVGVVENIQLLKNERKAVIRFKDAKQALSFQKKYQRYMLDLAMIQVALIAA